MFSYHLRKIYRKSFRIGEGKETSSKLKLFSYSLLFGSIILLIILTIFSGNPFAAISDSIRNIFSLSSNIDRSLVGMSILGLAGIAVAIGFKTGLFNIGVSGQMMIGALASGVFALYVGNALPAGLGQIVVLLISMLSAALFAMIAGLLKTYFGIHEVVSTILLNWVAFYLFQTIFGLLPDHLLTASKLTTVAFGSNYLFQINGNGMIPALILFIFIAFSLWFVIKKTTIGHKMIMVGKNASATKYAGINVKSVALTSLGLSGAVAGALGTLVYFSETSYLSRTLVPAIPGQGFSGIAIAILAFSNPLAVIPIAVIFGAINTIAINTFLINQTFPQLALAILMFISAINVVFHRFHVMAWIRIRLKGKEYEKRRALYVANVAQIDLEYYHRLAELKQENKKMVKTGKSSPSHKQKVRFLIERHMKSLAKQKENWKAKRDLTTLQGGT